MALGKAEYKYHKNGDVYTCKNYQLLRKYLYTNMFLQIQRFKKKIKKSGMNFKAQLNNLPFI